MSRAAHPRSSPLAPCALVVVLALAAALGACTKSDSTNPLPPAGSASAASSATASASGAASDASATGPILPPETVARPTEAQRAAGETLARQGGGGAIAACAGCHGTQGEGNGAAGFPRLAGQSYAYLMHALTSFANDSRNNPVMQPIAKAMSADQRQSAAAYYASLPPAAPASGPVATTPGSAGTGDARRGRELAEVGDESKHVQACANCHGPDGTGGAAGIPYLAGQHSAFLVSSLQSWRDGTRNSDPAAQMPIVAKSMDDNDAKAVAAYFSTLPAPAVPRDQDLMGTAGPAASGAAAASSTGGAAAVVSGPRSAPAATTGVGTGGTGGAAGATQGTGTEQGSPVNGGSQGNGPASPAPGGGAEGAGHGATTSGARASGSAAPNGASTPRR